MRKWPQTVMGTALAMLGAATLACSTGGSTMPQADQSLEDAQQKLSALERAVRERDEQLASQEAKLEKMSSRLERARSDVAAAPRSMSGSDLLPSEAKPGSCYARVVVPARYETDNVRVLKKERSEKINIQPARYEWVEERVLVKEASEKIEQVPPKYETVKEKVLVKPAHTAWKKGRGPIERVDNSTGEILCMVEVPAEYKTVTKRVLKSPATTRRVKIPAEYKSVRVRKMVEPPREQRIEIPAIYSEVTKRTKVSEERMEWRPVLCETNASTQLISSVQRSLKEAGYNPGPIDGVLGGQTMSAVRNYQKAKGLPSGGLTLTTLDALGVSIPR